MSEPAKRSEDLTPDEQRRAIRALERIADSLAAIASDKRQRRASAKKGHATQLKRVAKSVTSVYRPTELDKARARKLLGDP